MTRFVAIGLVAAAVFAGSALADTPSPRTACAADIVKLCPGATPGNGSIRQCMQSHKDQLSTGCKTAIAAVMAARQNAGH